jgi:hypothetical protein
MGVMIEPPVMTASESAHKLALRLAMQGQTVVYRCFDMWSVCVQREEIEAIAKRRHWFSYWIMGAWHVHTLVIRHRDGGSINFCVGWSVPGNVALEVRA